MEPPIVLLSKSVIWRQPAMQGLPKRARRESQLDWLQATAPLLPRQMSLNSNRASKVVYNLLT